MNGFVSARPGGRGAALLWFVRPRRTRRISRTPDHADRSLGRGRRHRRNRADHRQPDGERELAQPVNVVNRHGPAAGSLVMPHRVAAPDGYTIGMVTVEIGMMPLARPDRALRRIVIPRSAWSTPIQPDCKCAPMHVQERQRAGRRR